MSSWPLHVLSLEIRRVLTYRLDFWVNLVCALFARAGIAYFVWSEIFALRNVETIGGYDFTGMMMYYVIAALIYEVNQLDLGFFSNDIYDGSLTRYLVYPLSFLGYKYVLCFARALVHLVQVGIALALFALLIGIPPSLNISLLSISGGIIAALIASYLTFVMFACLDLVSFWADKVWSLGVMLQITCQLFGGVYFPISIFPEQFQGLVASLPFYFVVAFPVKVFFGEVSMSEFFMSALLAVFWAALFTKLVYFIWRRGTLRYTAVGQ